MKKENKTISVEGYEITLPIKCKTFKKAQKKCPEGFRLPKQWELFKIFGETLDNPLIKKEYEGFYWSSTIDLIDKNYCRGLYLNRDLIYSNYVDLVGSDGDGQVVYIKEKK